MVCISRCGGVYRIRPADKHTSAQQRTVPPEVAHGKPAGCPEEATGGYVRLSFMGKERERQPIVGHPRKECRHTNTRKPPGAYTKRAGTARRAYGDSLRHKRGLERGVWSLPPKRHRATDDPLDATKRACAPCLLFSPQHINRASAEQSEHKHPIYYTPSSRICQPSLTIFPRFVPEIPIKAAQIDRWLR